MNVVELLEHMGSLQIERPPSVWQVEPAEEPVRHLIDELIRVGRARGSGDNDFTLRISNVTVEDDPEDDEMPVAPGDYVALTVLASGDWRPEVLWSAGRADGPTLIDDDLDAAAHVAGVPFGYTRQLADSRAVTVFLRRLGE